MKIGIVTITELDNFGNRLQNYALQEILKSLGAEVDTIPNYITYRYRKSKERIVKEFLNSLRNRNRIQLSNILKQIRFSIFDKKYFNFSKYYSEIDYISPELNASYDFFIAGSDQIWNPYFPFNRDFNFLTFCDREKRISYSASFGVDTIPENRINSYNVFLSGINHLSVREYAGEKIIKELTGRSSSVLVDPTLLLSYNQWLEIARKPRWIKNADEYILTYFLGDISIKNNISSKIKNDSKYKNCQIIDINNPEIIKQFIVNPSEFIWLINNAKLVVTDSFHGTVFSIILGVPFFNVNRQDSNISMNSRIESLYTILDLEKCDGINNQHIIYREKLLSTIEKQRNKSIHYLSKTLNLV